MERDAKSQARLEGSDMNRRMSAGIVVVVALAVGLLFVGLVRQRAMARVEAEQAAAEAARQQAEEALGRENKLIAWPRQSRWEYRVVSIQDNDDAVNQVLNKLTEDRWEYVGVVQPASGPKGVYAARMLFRRIKQ
jgi:type II secretory pathway pseudopilin PulG